MSKGPIEDLTSRASKVYIRPAFQEIAQDYLEPLRRCDIDTLVLGCTHYPMLKALIGGVVGHSVLLVSSAEEMAKDVRETLTLRGQLASPDNVATREFFTSSDEVEEFQSFGSRVFNPGNMQTHPYRIFRALKKVRQHVVRIPGLQDASNTQ